MQRTDFAEGSSWTPNCIVLPFQQDIDHLVHLELGPYKGNGFEMKLKGRGA